MLHHTVYGVRWVQIIVPMNLISMRSYGPSGGVLRRLLFFQCIQELASSSIHDASSDHRRRRMASNIADPDYFPPSGVGGLPQMSGGDGSVVIITKKPTEELRSTFFYTGSREKFLFVVPGSTTSSPYHQVVQLKLWGAGGGCDGGRLLKESSWRNNNSEEQEEDNDIIMALSSGYAGGYIEASFDLPTGETLVVDVGGGGRSQRSVLLGSSISGDSSLLGGLGGVNGGKSGYRDASSGGGGGGGMSTVSFTNGTILAAAFGGDGGGNSSYCTALGGLGGRLRGMMSSDESYVNSELVLLVDNNANEDAIASSEINESRLGLPVQENNTPPMPQNQWIPVTIPHEVAVAEANTTTNTTSSWCEHSNHIPTGRRGHSMTSINNHVYIFGGALVKCVCTVVNDGKRDCSSKNVYSSELWHFDISSSMFTLLEPSGNEEEEDVPQGREQHSATVLPNGEIIIIGGLSGNNLDEPQPQPLNEVWKLSDPHHVTSHVISGEDSSTTQQLPMELNQSYLSSHTLNVDLGDDVCVEDLQLSVSLGHGCLEGLEFISLAGPTVPLALGQDSTQSRQYQTKLFVSTTENRERQCNNSSQFHLLFSDDAKESVLSYSRLPNEGTYRPASGSLKETFQHLAANGEWELTISTSKSSAANYNYNYNYTNGPSSSTLLDWKLHLQTKSCTPRVKWERILSVPSSFQPRYGHTAIVIDHSIFISGGFSQRRLNDLWRFDYLTNSWTSLTSTPEALRNYPAIQRQQAVLGPWGLLKYGGLTTTTTKKKQRSETQTNNNREDERLIVPLTSDNFSSSSSGSIVDAPPDRYLSSIVLMESNNNVMKKLYNIDDNNGPFLLMFGGDRGNSINGYPNSYGFLMPNTFLNDVWILSLGEELTTSASNNDFMDRSDYCIGRLDRDSTHYQIWNSTCGWEVSFGDDDDEPKDCELDEIFVMAWCEQNYQSFHMY